MLGWCFAFMLLLNLFENLEDDLRLISDHYCTPGEMEICSFHTNISHYKVGDQQELVRRKKTLGRICSFAKISLSSNHFVFVP